MQLLQRHWTFISFFIYSLVSHLARCSYHSLYNHCFEKCVWDLKLKIIQKNCLCVKMLTQPYLKLPEKVSHCEALLMIPDVLPTFIKFQFFSKMKESCIYVLFFWKLFKNIFYNEINRLVMPVLFRNLLMDQRGRSLIM